MRVIVYGVGAVGGTIAARLALSGSEVVGIARGQMLEAIRANGVLRLTSPHGVSEAAFPCYGDPAEITWRPDDVVLLAVKSQDTAGALERLRAAGVYEQPILCAQNGVANERLALRYFPNVYGMLVMIPAQYSVPGAVEVFGEPKYGLFDIGRYPSGTDEVTGAVTGLLNAAGFDCAPEPDVMANKYAKLLLNLGNMVEAAFGTRARHGPWYKAARKEGQDILDAAGIAYGNVDFDHPRRQLMRVVEIAGTRRNGSSSFQSLLRNAGSLETDFLNGEIVLIARLHGLQAPINAALCQISLRMLAEGIAPGDFPDGELERLVGETPRAS